MLLGLCQNPSASQISHVRLCIRQGSLCRIFLRFCFNPSVLRGNEVLLRDLTLCQMCFLGLECMQPRFLIFLAEKQHLQLRISLVLSEALLSLGGVIFCISALCCNLGCFRGLLSELSTEASRHICCREPIPAHSLCQSAL